MTIIAEAMKEAALRFARWMDEKGYSKWRKNYTLEEIYDMFLLSERERIEGEKLGEMNHLKEQEPER